MDRKISVSVALTITLIAMTVTVAITFVFAQQMFNNNISETTQRQALNNKISEIDKYVRGNYYGEINDTYLADRTARGYVDGLQDPNCTYYTEKEYTELLQIEEGRRVGIGLEIVRDASGYFRVIYVYPESPAAGVGIEKGFYIQQVDGVDARSYTTLKSMQATLRDLQGSTVQLTCLNNASEEQTFTIQRINYTAPTIMPLQMVDGFAYIQIMSFGPTTYAEFDYIIREAQAQGAKGYVFDVRGNTGGSYEQAYKMIDMVCPLGVIARAQYKNNITKALATSGEEQKVTDPMVVVVNGTTAGAAELFALSIRELAGGQVVGVQTAGRGMLQSSPFKLNDGSAIVVSQAKLFTGKDEAWDGVGVKPEVVVAAAVEDEAALFSVDPRTDPQIVRATELVRSLAKAAGADVSTTGGGNTDSSSSELPDATLPPEEDDGLSDPSSQNQDSSSEE